MKFKKGVEVMEELVIYLLNNPEIIQQVKDGNASLIGVEKEEVHSIIKEVDELITPNYYWR
ncbi:competence pheromone ComX [Gracilibacillus thailandensis]|uniref:ComX pheromone n=2 Tax=Gracilibacillus thailandensis TaxID=563735 RepID=A0A6N7QYC4_9BACI|nr:competence pheromone ComX [Gracilibacillus thailandensis]